MRHRQDARLYYSISEASAIAKVKPHVLRYWETQFKMLRPKKNKAGNRMYRKRDLRLIQIIKELLYDKGFTISGARRKLLDERAQLREQLDLPFTEVDRAALLAEIRRDLDEVLLELRGLKLETAGQDSEGSADIEDGLEGDLRDRTRRAGGELNGEDVSDLLDFEDPPGLGSSGFTADEMREALLGDTEDQEDSGFADADAVEAGVGDLEADDSDSHDTTGNTGRASGTERRVLPDESP